MHPEPESYKWKDARSNCHDCVWIWESLQRLTVMLHFWEEDCWAAGEKSKVVIILQNIMAVSLADADWGW